MDLSDPRLAQLITDLVDRRIRAFAEASQQVRYGIVDSIDVANRRMAVKVGASAVATPGFVYPAGYMRPVVGDLVRVVIAGADRYVDADLSGMAPTIPTVLPFTGQSRIGLACSAANAEAWTKATGGSEDWTSGDMFWNVTRDAIVPNQAGVYLIVYGGRFNSVGAVGDRFRIGFGTAVAAPPASPGIRDQVVVGSTSGSPLTLNGAGIRNLSATTNVSLFATQASTNATRQFDNGYLSLVRLGIVGALAELLPADEPDAQPRENG